MMPSDEDIENAIRDLAHRRGLGKTFCPSEVARAVASDWRPVMDDVRRIASGMDGIAATQKGETVDPVTAKGPIRLGLL
ncbi:uncharacterized protein DUF3253 [Litoreibacter ponti]|uniref:Uncharacterized protein DUF3253 n=1 Tax=Litoreibacter ponti TaxID=1510457 RepID=A0A2T6BE84_9RHOB|nr:DUF3253 domain-containing protein [Litoreibacter ponti]PTX54365.1 uncharacterized protein DUF3253 [Litoreibacter ponti]